LAQVGFTLIIVGFIIAFMATLLLIFPQEEQKEKQKVAA
jgi:uncharacterized membrane protein